MRLFFFFLIFIITNQGAFGLPDFDDLKMSQMNKVLMDSVAYRTDLEEIDMESDDYRYYLLGTFWKNSYHTYIWDRTKNTIRISNRRKWKTIIELRDRELYGFGMTKSGKLIVLTGDDNGHKAENLTIGIYRTNGRRETHLHFETFIEHHNLVTLELDFPDFYLLQEEFTTQIDHLGRDQKVFLGEPLHDDSAAHQDQRSIHVSLAGDRLIVDSRAREESSDLKRTLNHYDFNKDHPIDHICSTHRFKGKVKIILEGEIFADDNDEYMAPYYELYYDQKKNEWIEGRYTELSWKDEPMRHFWYYNNNVYMTEIEGNKINTFRFK